MSETSEGEETDFGLPGDSAPVDQRGDDESNDDLIPKIRALMKPPEKNVLLESVQAGEQVGPYRLDAVLGRGGMGAVFLARQTEPIRRRVALKVVRAGVSSKQVLARFEAERQSLAIMNHPNIAKVFDAGITEAGLPYFVMELVDGVPLTEFCDRERLSITDRLALFSEICRGVQHAHQKGVIHRDLKPSNILVALEVGKPVPKIIDFGLAKAVDDGQFSGGELTEMGQILGTVRYMSPEQAQLGSLDIDTRSDIYALGVILYELVSGSTPIDAGTLAEKPLLDVLNIIRTQDPTRVSSRLTACSRKLQAISAQRGTTPLRLKQLVRGDLDWIVTKAVEVDRTRRYASAAEFADDIGRYLANEPISARPSSPAYHVKKLVQRHRSAIAIATLLFLALSTATTISVVSAVRANAASARSEATKERALAALGSVEEFVLDSPIWRASSPERDALIDLIAHEYEYWSQSSAVTGEETPLLASALIRLAALEREAGRFEESKSLATRAIKILEQDLTNPTQSLELGMAEAEALFVDVGIVRDNEELLAETIRSIRSRLARIQPNQLSLLEAERLPKILLTVGSYRYSTGSKATYSVGASAWRLCHDLQALHPHSQELNLQSARALNLMAISLHKGYAQIDESEVNASRIPAIYSEAIEILQATLEADYRPLECRRILLGVYSNLGMNLANKRRFDHDAQKALLDHYDASERFLVEVLAAHPKLAYFQEVGGLLLTNKGDAYRKLAMWAEESEVRKRAHKLLVAATDQVSTAGLAGRRLASNLNKLALNQYRIGQHEQALEYARLAHERGVDAPNDDALARMTRLRLVAENLPLDDDERKQINKDCDAIFQRLMAARVRFDESSWRLIAESELFARYREQPEFSPVWAEAMKDRPSK